MNLERLKVDLADGIRHYVVKGPAGAVVGVVLHTEGFPEELTNRLTLTFPFVAYIDRHYPTRASREGAHGDCQYLDGQACRLRGWSPDPFGDVYKCIQHEGGEEELYRVLEQDYREAFGEKEIAPLKK